MNVLIICIALNVSFFCFRFVDDIFKKEKKLKTNKSVDTNAADGADEETNKTKKIKIKT